MGLVPTCGFGPTKPAPPSAAVEARFRTRESLSELRGAGRWRPLQDGARSPACGAPAALRGGRAPPREAWLVGSAARGLSATFAGPRRAARGLLARFVFQRVGCRAEVLACTAAKTGRPSSCIGDSLERDGPSSGVTAAGTRAPPVGERGPPAAPARIQRLRPGELLTSPGPERGQAACLSVSCCLERLGIAFKSFGFSSF